MDGIVTGQRVGKGQLANARDLRRRMTPAECVLWQALRGKQLAGLRFRRQQIIGGFIVDFYCHALRLVIEVDGPIHEQQADYDRERDLLLAARGLRVVRVTNADVMNNLPTVLALISPPLAGEGPGEG